VAPEQIEGHDLDGRADVYSLGCVLFHCLTGSVPFERMNDIEVVFAHLREPPPSLSGRAPGLPTGMDAVVARAMAKSRDDRWPTCSALVAAMQAEVRSTAPAPASSADAETRSMHLPPVASTSPPRPPPGAASASAAPTGTEPAPAPSAAVHRGDGGGRRGRWWLLAVAAIVLPAAAYFGTTLLSEERPPVGDPPATAVDATRPPGEATCPGGFTRPAVGTPTRTAPLDAIRAHMGWSDQFVVDEMRVWRASNGERQWYVKARQEGDRSRQGRWLVGQEPEAQPRVLATAAFDTEGYKASDWDVADGQEAPTGLAGCLAGT
jgi:hypothetical protein